MTVSYINKLFICTALILLGGTSKVHAALANNAVLDFNAGVESCVYGGIYPDCSVPEVGLKSAEVTGGSWFALDSNADGVLEIGERAALTANEGLILGAVQDAGGTHSGAPDGSETYGIDQPWEWFGSTGVNRTTSPVTVVSGANGNYQLDFSGWGIQWSGIDFALGGDRTVTNEVGSSSLGSGLATLTCTTLDCVVGSDFILDYDVEFYDPSGFGIYYSYALHLEGTIAAVPLPTSMWLFVSGLFTLISIKLKSNSCK